MAISQRHSERRSRNLALGVALVAFVVLIFFVALYKMGGL
jgi:hypothetical protein